MTIAGDRIGREEQTNQCAVGPGHYHPGHLGMAHPVHQRRGILAGPHGGHAEPHHRPCLLLCRGGLQAVTVATPRQLADRYPATGDILPAR
jgi:hypothetical protein